MIGLDIKIKNKYSNYLLKILAGINFDNYNWEIITDDIIKNGKQGIFSNSIIDGNEFLRCISEDSYNMIFVDIKAYPVGKERTPISTFKDFMESYCDITFLCTDSGYIEIYCKDRKVLDTIYNNCIGEDFEKVEYITEEKATGRTLIAF